MNARQRFNAIMKYESVDKLPILAIEWYYEEDTLKRWYNEGLPFGLKPEEFFGMDKFIKVPTDFCSFPRFDQKAIANHDDYFIEIEPRMGTTVKRKKNSPAMYYGHVAHPVRDLDDWQKYKKKFKGNCKDRIPTNLDYLIEKLNSSQNPVNLNFWPFLFRLGFYALGMEKFMLSFYDNSRLIHEMFSYWTEFCIEVIKPYLKLRIDIVTINEDLAYKNAPHISPDIYKKFWLPYQNILIEELKKNNVSVICLWTAGDIDVLIPTLLHNGINCISTVEQCSKNMNPLRLRKEYGKDLLMLGGISKRSIIYGPSSIDKEIEILMPLIEEGGYIPAIEDVIPPEVPFKHYRYYINKLYSIMFGRV